MLYNILTYMFTSILSKITVNDFQDENLNSEYSEA
jgi:hypothetical protein